MSRRRSATGGPGSLPLLPRLGECGPAASVALFIDVLAPPSPPPANGSARGARPQPITAPLPGILPGPSSNSCGRLVTRPPAPRGAPPGGAGRRCRARPRGSPGAGPPALRDPRPSRTPGPQAPPAPPAPLLPASAAAGPENRARPCPRLGALPARTRCQGPWRRPGRRARGGVGGTSCTAVGRKRKKPQCLRETRSSDPYPYPTLRGGACVAPRYAPGQESPYGERFKTLKFNLGDGTFPSLAHAP